MKKIIIFSIIGLAFIAVLVWFGKMNSKSPIQFETEKPFKTDIVRKTVATGKVTPVEEIEIKPQVSGIIDKIYLEEGVQVKKGDLSASNSGEEMMDFSDGPQPFSLVETPDRWYGEFKNRVDEKAIIEMYSNKNFKELKGVTGYCFSKLQT